MWRAWSTTRPLAVTVQRACSALPKRGLAETTPPRPQLAAASLSQTNRPDLAPSGKAKWAVMDGNEAAAYIAYAMSDISFIYPISPATSMGELMDKWAASGQKNVLGQIVDVNMMQSEAGAAGALHGAAAAGSLTSTFTASQGLLLMIPNMYLLAGELMPTVLHVSARTVSKHALSIFNDHSDVMATRQTGFAMLCSSSVQEVMDMALSAHVASLKSRLPYLHFFDGFRTSAEMSKIQMIPHEDIAQIFPTEKVKEHLHDYALNPYHPMIRGTGQRPDIFFQNAVAANKYYNNCPYIMEEVFEDVAKLTGRKYELFSYFGHPEADKMIVVMGSAAKTVHETVEHMNSKGEKVGMTTVHLYRPWSPEHFLRSIPETVKKVAVLDRTREDGASGSPLFLDVNVTFSDAGTPKLVTGGQYGLASKEFTPIMAKSVFDNLDAAEPKMRYVVGVNDDVTHSSLEYGAPIKTTPETTRQCLFWGLGSDGTVGANKTAIKTIGLNTDMKAQGHFVYDSHKADGVTVSHLRFGPDEIKSEYGIQRDADYLSCHHPSYVYKFDAMLDPVKKDGIFVLNSPWTTMEEMEKKLPAKMKNVIADKHLKFYNINAGSLARNEGLGKRINMVMQAAFYGLSGVLPVDQAMELLNESIETQYKHKGPKVIAKNHAVVEATMSNLMKIDYPESWKTTTAGGSRAMDEEMRPEFVSNIMDPVLALEGDDLPVSAFEPGGYQPIGTSAYEKRGIAPNIPVWVPDNCTQCNYCAIVCPHAVVRPFLLNKGETKGAPPGFEARKAKGGAEVGGYNYTIQISPYDCTGCEVCVESCPDDALYMAPFNEVADEYAPHWDYAIGMPERSDVGDRYSVKGSQFQKPLLEFSGACAGCGETPYLKLATQLFGDRMVIANASGCSSVWGGTSTTIPFTTNKDGRGPAWGRSLFEDNAEYGFGMMLATKQRRLKLQQEISNALLEVDMPEDLSAALNDWIKYTENPDRCDAISTSIEKIIERDMDKLHPRLQEIYRQKDMLRTQSHWLVGGDGWAYDIGYGGLDHVISRGENVNILVLDTEMYSNTGGQVSKATQLSTVTKFASTGKRQIKKELGLCAMQYENVYVASVALGANMNQCVTAFKEAEHYPGTSIIIAYSPCIDWGIEMKHMMDDQKHAVESGYWTLYRFDPRRADKSLNAFQLDSKKIKTELEKYLTGQNRFDQLKRADLAKAKSMQSFLNRELHHRHSKWQKMSMDDHELLEHLKKRLGEEINTDKSLVLYGSETGNAAQLAGVFANELKRRGVRAKCMAMDDFDFEELPAQDKVFCIVATCGQGEFPGNCKDFWHQLSDKNLPTDYLKDTKFCVFGLGDSSYVFFNEAAKRFNDRFAELGAASVLDLGMGDDKDEEKYESVWNEWLPELWNELGTDPPAQVLLPPTYHVQIEAPGASAASPDVSVPPGTRLIPMITNRVLTPLDYDRDIRHYEFDLSESGMSYSVGDCLGIYPHNDKQEVNTFLEGYGLDPQSMLTFEDTQDRKDVLPNQMTASGLFTEVLDVFGRPSRRFYETMAIAAKDESEKKEIEHILSKEGKERMKELMNETVTYANLMQMFPSTKLSLEYLVDHVPRIRPRLYSIASSIEMHPEQVQLCIVKEDWTTPSGVYRHGMCTRYLAGKSQEGQVDYVASKMNAAGINVPDTHAFPCVMVGLGTGIAPFRAMVEDREVARLRGETVGPMSLFFGARYKRTDYTYGDELEEYHSSGKGVLTNLSCAFSRDQAHKIYVQNRIEEHPEIIYDALFRKKGYFYLCGPAGNVPPSVRKAVCQAAEKVGGYSAEEADKMVTQMQIEGRYNVEAW